MTWVRRGGLTTVLFLLPTLFTFFYFEWWPIGKSLVISLQRTNLVSEPTWVGFDNFERIFNDPLLWTAARNSLWFTILMLVGFPIAVILGVFISELHRTRSLATVFVYLPTVVPPVVAVLLWKAFYNPSETGVFNTVLGWVGVGPFPWLQDATSAMPSIVVQSLWMHIGGTVIIYLAALRGIRTELYEAAEVDGASISRRFWHITLPQLRFVILIVLLLGTVGSVQMFTQAFVMTSGGPENATTTVLILIYRYAFISGDYGAATALSLLLAVFLSLLSAAYLLATRRWSTS